MQCVGFNWGQLHKLCIYTQQALKLSQDSSEVVSIHTSFGDLDALISSLSSAIQEEMDKSQVESNMQKQT